MSIAQYLPKDFQRKARLKIAMAVATGAGGMVSLLNPFGVDVFIDRAIVDVTTKSTSAATANVGVDADGATGDDTLLDGVDIGTAAILADNLLTPGTNGLSLIRWGSTQYLVMSGAADPAGAVGNLYVDVHRI
jgi:hypothetical protein